MRGSEGARYMLGLLEQDDGNMNRAIKHWMIAATAGHDSSIMAIKRGFASGLLL